MNNLQLVKSENFGEVKCDFYRQNDEWYMTIAQLADALEYANGRKGIETLIDRNSYLREEEFSVTLKMRATDGKQYNTRIFTEDGIYEVTMLSKTEKAKEFRTWVRKILKALRSGELKLVGTAKDELTKLEIQKKRADAMYMNAQARTVNILMKAINDKKLSPIAAEVYGLKCVEQITGVDMGQYLPEHEKTYSATEIAKMLGCTPNRIGKIANQYGIKTPEYGITVLDKARGHNKEVCNFRYNQRGVAKLQELIS